MAKKTKEQIEDENNKLLEAFESSEPEEKNDNSNEIDPEVF